MIKYFELNDNHGTLHHETGKCRTMNKYLENKIKAKSSNYNKPVLRSRLFLFAFCCCDEIPQAKPSQKKRVYSRLQLPG